MINNAASWYHKIMFTLIEPTVTHSPRTHMQSKLWKILVLPRLEPAWSSAAVSPKVTILKTKSSEQLHCGCASISDCQQRMVSVCTEGVQGELVPFVLHQGTDYTLALSS